MRQSFTNIENTVEHKSVRLYRLQLQRPCGENGPPFDRGGELLCCSLRLRCL